MQSKCDQTSVHRYFTRYTKHYGIQGTLCKTFFVKSPTMPSRESENTFKRVTL